MSILLAAQDLELIGRCRRALSAEHRFEVSADIAGLTGKIGTLAPIVVLLDAALLERPLERQVAQLVAAAGTARVIVLTEVFQEDEEIALLKAGAKGCCRRGIDPESLERVINVTQSGGVWVTRSLLPRLVTELRRYAGAPQLAQAAKPPAPKPAMDRLASLSAREREIARLIVAGASNKEVAAALQISERTVKGHLSNVFQKLHVTDRLKLMLLVRGQ
jgi:two-component system NarL family response regulator